MSYAIGIDVGTTWTAAAVARDGRTEIVQLGSRSAVVPSVVLLRGDDTVLTGEAAARRATSEPSRVAREFKRRLGDPTPLLLGGTPQSAEAITGRLLESVVAQVRSLQGGPADALAVTHPANWGEFKLDLLRQAIRIANLGDALLLPEPVAAAIHYAAQERVPDGATLGVYDLGGGTFDAAVLAKRGDDFELLGRPEGIERLGGIDFDAAVLGHVRANVGDALDGLGPDDMAAVRLRDDCTAAKEALSSDTETTIPVLLPDHHGEVHLSRAEFESAIRPALDDTVAAMRRALDSASVSASDLHAVLLVGGSSRIPLVAEILRRELGADVAVDTHPKHAVALGAAEAAARGLGGGVTTSAVVAGAGPGPAQTSAADSSSTGTAADTTVVAATATGSSGASVAADGASLDPHPTGEIEPVAATASMAAAAGPASSVFAERAVTPTPRPRVRPAVLYVASLVVLVACGFTAYLILTDDDPVAVEAGDDEAGDGEAGSGDVDPGADPPADPGDETGDASGDDGAGDAATTTASAAPTTTALADTASCTGGPCAVIEAVEIRDGELHVMWDARGFQPDTAQQHAHFFWNIYEAAQAGTNASARGVEGGDWELTDDQTFIPSGAMRLSQKPADADGFCVTVADSAHGVIEPDNVHCVPLPS